jgi:hypothetical protein
VAGREFLLARIVGRSAADLCGRPPAATATGGDAGAVGAARWLWGLLAEALPMSAPGSKKRSAPCWPPSARGRRCACLLEPAGIFEDRSREAPSPSHLPSRLPAAAFSIPKAWPARDWQDIFEGWEEDEFFLAFINRRVALVVVCPDGEALREQAERPLKALADRLLRFKDTYRMDTRGRGFFFGRARLDIWWPAAGRPGRARPSAAPDPAGLRQPAKTGWPHLLVLPAGSRLKRIRKRLRSPAFVSPVPMMFEILILGYGAG